MVGLAGGHSFQFKYCVTQHGAQSIIEINNAAISAFYKWEQLSKRCCKNVHNHCFPAKRDDGAFYARQYGASMRAVRQMTPSADRIRK